MEENCRHKNRLDQKERACSEKNSNFAKIYQHFWHKKKFPSSLKLKLWPFMNGPDTFTENLTAKTHPASRSAYIPKQWKDLKRILAKYLSKVLPFVMTHRGVSTYNTARWVSQNYSRAKMIAHSSHHKMLVSRQDKFWGYGSGQFQRDKWTCGNNHKENIWIVWMHILTSYYIQFN